MNEVLSERFEEKLLKFPNIARQTLTLSYLIRFIAILVYVGVVFMVIVNPSLIGAVNVQSAINIVGVVLAVIAWYYIMKWSRDTGYLLAFIGSIAIIASLVISTYISYTAGLLTQTIVQNQSISFIQFKEQYIKNIEQMQNVMRNPLNYGSTILMGIGLILEGLGFKALKRDSGGTIPIYIFILLLIIGILQIVTGVLNPIVADSLEPLKEDARNAGSLLDFKTLEFKLSIALLPLVLVALPMFIISIFTYIITALKVWKINEQIKKLKMIMEKPEEKKPEEEELLI